MLKSPVEKYYFKNVRPLMDRENAQDFLPMPKIGYVGVSYDYLEVERAETREPQTLSSRISPSKKRHPTNWFASRPLIFVRLIVSRSNAR